MKMTVRKNSWIRRVIAAGMAMGMVVSTTLPSLAKGAEGDGYDSKITAENSLAGADSAGKTEAADPQAGGMESAETESSQDGTDPVAPEEQTGYSENEQKGQQTEAATEAQEQKVQLSLELLSEGLETEAGTPSLTLEAAAKLSSDKLKYDNKTKTIEARDGDGLILLSNVYPALYKDYEIKLITTSGWDLTGTVKVTGTDNAEKEYIFLGLGDEKSPYEGTFRLDKSTSADNFSITTKKALFNVLSTSAALPDTIPFRVSDSENSTEKPLLAETLKADAEKKTLSANIVLRDLNADKISEAAIGGLINTMEESTSANITFTNQFSKPLKVSSSSHTGLFCNTMKSGALLTARLVKGAGEVSVEATASEADAGGFVGYMTSDNSLTVAGSSVDQVISASGNAGGLAGSVTDGSIGVQAGESGADAGEFIFGDSLTLKAGSGKAAGGLIGEYAVTKGDAGNSISYDLSKYVFQSITVSGGGNVGGLFGVLKNTSTDPVSVAVSGKTEQAITTNVSSENEVTNLGGLIGSYATVDSADKNSAAVMKNTLAIKGSSSEAGSFIQVASTGGAKAGTTYGGVIGAVSGSSYVEIENVSASIADMKNSTTTSVGGLVGKLNDGLLNVGSVTLTTTGGNDLGSADAKNPSKDTDQVEGHGGLVGHLVKGVLRIHGTTDLSGQKITTAYHHVGQVVGFNENGLIYAVGNGNSLNADGSGWSLVRYSGTDRGGSDIGNWGAVVRLGDQLTEGDDGVVTFDQAAHTVQVKNGTGSGIDSANAFAAYALAFDLSKVYTGSGSSAALSFAGTVDAAAQQTVTLTGDIDLTGTGIIGIGKDNVEKGVSAYQFKGTLDGGGYTITLDIGTVYGKDVSENDNASGQLHVKRSDQRNAHYSLALIPFAGDVTISNLTIAGNVSCKIPKTVKQEEKDIKSPAFAAGAIGLASGTTAFNHVTVNTKVSVTEETGANKLLAWQGGFLARCEGSTLSFTDYCTWGSGASLDDERNTDNHRIGGLAAEVMGGCTVTVNDSVLSGSITSKSTANANIGGLIAVSRGEDSGNKSRLTTINIANLKVNGEKITTSADVTSGGLLGYQWKNTNVVFAAPTGGSESAGTDAGTNNGVTISGSALNAKNAQFGGLVYQATGYWNATAKDSIVFSKDNQANTFTGKSEEDTPSGLLVGTGLITETNENQTNTVVESALYLEVGTWGNASDAAYKINSGAVTLRISNSQYFDELAGITRFDDAGNNNAVVSLAIRDSSGKAACIDKGGTTNTYTGQSGNANYKNSKARYYYNLDSYRKDKYTTDLKTINTAQDLVLWSAAQYAAENIRTCFRKEIISTPDNIFITSISGDLNLDGYSYYPVTPLTVIHIGSESENGPKTTLTFAYDTMNTIEGTNKPFSDSEHQHYLMQHGLLYNTSHGILVNQTSFAGVVGKEEFKGAGDTEDPEAGKKYSSGALIYGSVIGNPGSNIVGITLKNVTLDGIKVANVEKGNATYAPLLINRIAKAAKLTVKTISASEKYMTGEGENKTTMYAATSLIGSVGSNTASKLTLSFSNLALDGRVKEDETKSTSVWNNGKILVEYHTTHTIFTRAILMEYFMYSSDGFGTYNFNSTDSMVTYGVELTNTGTTGRNPDKQYQYYDADIYIIDEKDKSADETYVKGRYTKGKFLRYVNVTQDINNSTYELDINQRSTGLLKGCGTYGDPYLIEDALQLSSLASYISGSDSKFQAVFNSEVLADQTQTAKSYHTQGNDSDTTGKDILYTWENKEWKADGVTAAIDTAAATRYLLNAYYKIEKDITISAETFSGLGTLTNPFSGVIVGESQLMTTVFIQGTNGNKDSFGGLIAYSRGSVVKDLTVDYSQATIQMQAESCPGTQKNPFFGGVVGYCMGGDTIIDSVSTNYSGGTVSFSGTYAKLIAAGGYVGLVGGATHVTETTDYEKTGGGVVFRNMAGTTNNFTAVCAEAAVENKKVNMVDVDASSKAGKSASDGGSCFYQNPYVGRVLDGYACAENCKVENTDKNYMIPTLAAGTTTDLTVSENTGVLDTTVASAQGLWLLSAIVNSGAGAMDSTGSYTDVDNQVVDAYQYGKPRTVSYEEIGADAGGDADTKLADEKYWGGIASTAGSDDAKARVSYLVKNYTAGEAAARLAGKSSSALNIPVNLTFSADIIDMTGYGNGFRGIGCSYGENKKVGSEDCSIPKVYRRNPLIKGICADKTSTTTIKLSMNQNSYRSERLNGSWRSQGAGLFVDFHFTDGCTVNKFTISGEIKLGLFDNDKLTYMTIVSGWDVGVGGFAARTANSAGKVTFNGFSLNSLEVYGGSQTGGAIGYIDGYQSKNARNVIFNFKKIENANISRWIYDNGSSGGLVGWNTGYGTVEINGTVFSSEENVKNLTVTTYAESSDKPSASAGGLVGACDSSSVSIAGVTADRLKVTGEKVRDIGGLIAGKRNGKTNNIAVNNCVLHAVEVNNPIDDKDSSTGGIIGYHDNQLTISKVTIDQNSKISGQQYTGGFAGQSFGNVTISNCKENKVYVKSGTRNWVGGFIGYLSSNKLAIFQACKEEDVNILGRYVGGLVGTADGSIQASNIEFINVTAVTKYKETENAGLLTGSTDNINKHVNSVKGYNILAKSCKVGYATNVDVENLSKAPVTLIDNVGFWVGVNGASDTINLTAVSAYGDIFPQQHDIGKQKNTTDGSATIIYANASADQTYTPTDSKTASITSASPWLDVNPKSKVEVPFADGTVMTGNAAGSGTASAILEELSKEKPASAYYWNVNDDTKKSVVKLLNSSNDAYLTTYRAEESATTTVSKDVDFPVLVVNNSAEVDTLLWNYIAAMTNVSAGTTAKKQVKDIVSTTYRWDEDNGNFVAQKPEKSSLTISTAKKISIVPNAYDNQSSQFTLLDVTYADPTDSNETHVFHLYIPVLVKKVLYINFKTRFLAGTDYCASDYLMADTGKNHYATAGFNEPVTAYMQYSYEKDTDWQSMLDNGENLLWYYDKILDLASGSTVGTDATLLPKGTRLTLVDRQTKQYYTYTTTGDEDFHNFNLAVMEVPDDADAAQEFRPVYICDLLGLKAERASETKDGVTYYVKEQDSSKATVRIGSDYYREAGENDTGDKYRITMEDSSKTQARTEEYYLTIQIPETKELSIVNNRLYAAAMSRKEGTLPSVIKSDKEINSSAYVVYNGVQQSFSISTSRIHNGSAAGDTAMENGDGIRIRLIGKMWLTEAGIAQFQSLGPSKVYHEFDVSLQKYLNDNSMMSDVIGTENVKYTYTFSTSDNTSFHSESGSISNAAGLETLTLQYGSSDLKKKLESARSEVNAVIITADITLTYDLADHFPVRNTTNSNDQSGISVTGVSRIANTSTQLPITENKKSDTHKNRYYITNRSKASLTYFAVAVETNDATRQLGINPSDTVNSSDMIQTRADYDYTSVDADILATATQIRYTLELFQKNDTGTYDESNPLVIRDYLQEISKDNEKGDSDSKNTEEWQKTDHFVSKDEGHQFARIQFTPLTGGAFEEKGYTYANYKVRLTAVLLDQNGAEIDGTKASDYIIYTNARIYQQILETMQGAAAGN